jgi:peptidyl-prolyl cis-trans isomerase D
MIVISKTSATDTNAVQLAREIQTKLKEGAPFSEMANIYSQGSQQRQGGDWGWIETDKLRKELAEAAVRLTPGQIGETINTDDSLYIMQVEDKKAAHPKPLAEVRVEIEKTLRVQQQAQLQKQWIDGLKKKTFVRYF